MPLDASAVAKLLHEFGQRTALRGGSPAFIVMKAADEFKDKTTAPNQLWQTDFSVPQQAA